MSKRHLVRGQLGWCAALLSMCAAAQAAEQVVLESNSPAYPAGRTFESTAQIALAPEEFVVFATEDGRLLRVAGPYTGPAGGTDESTQREDEGSVRRIIAQIFGLQPEETGALGGVRGPAASDTDGADTRTDPWLLHSARTGDQCIVSGRPVRFWREAAAAALSADVLEIGGARVAVLQWPAQVAVAEWPSAAPTDGEIYLVRANDELRSAAIRLHALPAALEPQSLVTVAWLASQGCIDQARLLLRSLPPTSTADR